MTLPGPLLPPMLRLDAADAATFDDVAVAEAERFAAADAVLRTKLLSMLAYMFESSVGLVGSECAAAVHTNERADVTGKGEQARYMYYVGLY